MYNRYVRGGDGAYERIPTPEGTPSAPGPERPPPAGRSTGQRSEEAPPEREPAAGTAGAYLPAGREKPGILSGLMSRLKLDGIDSGDLLLLAILFLLFREGEDEELLIALGLLLIL